MCIVGFDFGTTNSLVAQIVSNTEVAYDDEDGLPTPSLVCYESDRIVSGREAKQKIEGAGLGVHGNIVRSPKTLLKNECIYVGGIEKSSVDVVTDSIAHTISEAKKIALKKASKKKEYNNLENINSAVVTIPVKMIGQVRQRLRDAFNNVGISIHQFVHEPFAALYGYIRQNIDDSKARYDNKTLIVVDWGGGTLDITLCKLKDNAIFQIVNGCLDEAGGDNFDDLILNYVLKKVCQERNIENPTILEGSKARLLEQCEKAKKYFSNKSINSGSIYVKDFFVGYEDNDLDYNLSREEFDNIVKPIIDGSFSYIRKLVSDSNISTDQIHMCLATGGMANVAEIRSRLFEIFGPSRTKIPENTTTLVALGAAWIAHDDARLMLAKPVELQMANNSYLPLFYAGTTMPSCGDALSSKINLYCTDPTDGNAKFVFCTLEFPEDRLNFVARKILDIITLPVDNKQRRLFERIELNYSINDNLVLKLTVSSLLTGEEASCEIHDLEFALNLSKQDNSDNKIIANNGFAVANPISLGTISVRSNISDKCEYRLVPGEVLYRYQPGLFDVRLNYVTDLQREEHMYYMPCSLCHKVGRACKCRIGK